MAGKSPKRPQEASVNAGANWTDAKPVLLSVGNPQIAKAGVGSDRLQL